MTEEQERQGLEMARIDAKMTAEFFKQLTGSGVEIGGAWLMTQSWLFASKQAAANAAAVVAQRCPRCGGSTA